MDFVSGLFKDIIKCIIIGISVAAVVMLIAWGIGSISYRVALSGFTRDLTQGIEGEDVKQLENLLISSGYLEREENKMEPYNPIAKYDDKTTNAISSVQEDKGLSITGNADRQTIKALLKDLKLFTFIRNGAYYTGIIGLMLSVAFFIKRDATRPLEFEEQWKEYFSVLNLALVIMFVGLTIGFMGMIFQSIAGSGLLG